MSTVPRELSAHRPGCVCGMTFFAPALPERQAELRSRMLAQTKEDTRKQRQARISELCRARDWHATLIILTSDVLNRDGRVWCHVDLDMGLIHFRKILRDYTFSSGERALVEIAASLFGADAKVDLWKVFNKLDHRCSEIVIHAIQVFTGIKR